MGRNGKWAELALVASRQSGVVSRAQAYQAGLTAKQLRTAVMGQRLFKPASDVFVFTTHPSSFRQRCQIASLTGGVVSHASAAALHQLDGFARHASQPVHVSFHRDNKRALPTGFVVHTWSYTSHRDIDQVDSIACTSVARTLVQLGLHHPRPRVEIALDSALRAGAKARWIEKTLLRLRRPGRTGQQVLEEIIADPARSGALSESVLESVVERVIADSDLPRPIRQHEIVVGTGTRRFDLAFPDAKLGIEAHSRRFHFGRGQDEADNLRDIELAAAGWEVLYITWGMAHEPALFMRLLKRTYQQRRRLLRVAS